MLIEGRAGGSLALSSFGEVDAVGLFMVVFALGCGSLVLLRGSRPAAGRLAGPLSGRYAALVAALAVVGAVFGFLVDPWDS